MKLFKGEKKEMRRKKDDVHFSFSSFFGVEG